jgi:hypothetical protein
MMSGLVWFGWRAMRRRGLGFVMLSVILGLRLRGA